MNEKRKVKKGPGRMSGMERESEEGETIEAKERRGREEKMKR